MKSFDYLAAFYQAKHGPQNFVRELDSLLAAEDATVRAIPFGCDRPNADWLDGCVCGDKKLTLLYRKDALLAFRLDYKFTEHGQQKSASGSFFILQQPDLQNVFVAFSLEPTTFFRRALLPLFQGLYLL